MQLRCWSAGSVPKVDCSALHVLFIKLHHTQLRILSKTVKFYGCHQHPAGRCSRTPAWSSSVNEAAAAAAHDPARAPDSPRMREWVENSGSRPKSARWAWMWSESSGLLPRPNSPCRAASFMSTSFTSFVKPRSASLRRWPRRGVHWLLHVGQRLAGCAAGQRSLTLNPKP